MLEYKHVNMRVTAEEAENLNTLLGELGSLGYEGCTSNIFTRRAWPDDSVLVYDAMGTVDHAKSPPCTHYVASGAMNMLALEMLPEDVVVEEPDVVPVLPDLPRGVKPKARSRAGKPAGNADPKPDDKVRRLKEPKVDEIFEKLPQGKKPAKADLIKTMAAVKIIRGESIHAMLKRDGLKLG